MKKLVFYLGILFSSYSFSQSCLPEGIIFNKQTQIDSFQFNYPGCQRVEGNVKIEGPDIRNLYGLSQLREFGADLIIRGCDSLSNLTGLDSVTYIGGGFSIAKDSMLRELAGVNLLDTIGGPLILADNIRLEHVNALQNLTYVGSSIGIHSNPVLKNLNGLESVKSFVRYIFVNYNYELEDILGLRGIPGTSVYIKIQGNPLIKDLEGLKGIRTIRGKLIIDQNYSLISLRGLENVDSINGMVKITSNPLLLYLDALKHVRQIGGLYISHNESLLALKAFDSLINIRENCSFFNNSAMESLEGLNKLSSIGGNLHVCCGNYVNLNPLSSLYSIRDSGSFWISGNNALTDVSGIKNIATNSIKDLQISYNPLLSVCDIDNICSYLDNPDAEVEIHNNNTGCNSVIEVKEACQMDVADTRSFPTSFFIFPNPASKQVNIELPALSLQQGIASLSIFNIKGHCEIKCTIIQPKTVLDISDLNVGVYTVKVVSKDKALVRKLLVN